MQKAEDTLDELFSYHQPESNKIIPTKKHEWNARAEIFQNILLSKHNTYVQINMTLIYMKLNTYKQNSDSYVTVYAHGKYL